MAEPAKSPRSDLQLKLVWLTAFRVVATSLLLGATALRLFSRPAPETLSFEDSASFALIGFVYVLTLISGLVLRRGRFASAVAYLQVAGDLLVASSVVYLTGGLESPFTFTYSVAVIAAAILLPQRGALIVAALGATAFAGQAWLIQRGLLRPPQDSGPITAARVGFVLASNALAQVLVAALVGYLARQLNAAGGRLSQREAEVKSLAALQRQILACMPSGLITCTAQGEVTFVNRAAEQILELSPGAPPPPVEAILPGVLRVPTARGRHELAAETRSGKKTLGLSVTPLEEAPGGALLIVFQDLTELKRMEEDLRRADRLAAVGTLAAQLAHEIRNPLASMRGSAQLLAQDLAEVPSAGRLSAILVRESDRLSALVEDFLKFARPPPPSLARTRLDALVAETVEMLRADPLARGVDLVVEAEPSPAEVDADQLRQVLLNLVRNALEAARPGGQVKVRVEASPGPRIHVWDSAGSIPPADMKRIFEPFFTTRDRGTGLGLSTAHAIVQAHGGTISVSSTPQRGTEFVVEPRPRRRALHVLVVDDELSMREYLEVLLQRFGHQVTTAADVRAAAEAIAGGGVDLIISDMKLGAGSGMEVLRAARAQPSPPEVILITAYGTPASAVEAMRAGAYDYICKPFDNEELRLLVSKALEKRALLEENRELKKTLSGTDRPAWVGLSPAMQQVAALVDKVAASRSTVLVTGESGTGKELVARAIHRKSPRASAPFLAVNCAALAEGVLESELFGHVKGAFTGAIANRAGILVSAGEGTVLLDEVGEISLGTQVKLLRVLQERKVKPVGSTAEVPFSARVLAATNKNLDAEVKAGRFREDLLYRLNVITVDLPPLRARGGDIALLAEHFLGQMREELGRPRLRFAPELLELFERYAFPGNVRQLQNLVERAATLSDSDVLGLDALPPALRGQPEAPEGAQEALPVGAGFSLEKHLDQLERRYLTHALEKAEGVKTRAAELLGLSFRSFRYRLAKHGLSAPDEAEKGP